MSVNFAGISVIRFSAYFKLGNQLGVVDRWLSALSVVPGTAWNSTNLFAAMAAASLHTFFQAAISDNATLLGYKLYQKQTGAPPLVDRDISIAGACSGGAGELPTQNAALIRFSSSLGGSRGHGRMYLPFPYTTALAATGLLGVTYKGFVQTLADAIVTGFTVPNAGTGGGTLTVRPCTVYTLPVTGLALAMDGSSVADGFATQRRRGFFGKPNTSSF